MSVSDWIDQRIKIKRWEVWIFGFNENNTWSVVPAKRNTFYLSILKSTRKLQSFFKIHLSLPLRVEVLGE